MMRIWRDLYFTKIGYVPLTKLSDTPHSSRLQTSGFRLRVTRISLRSKFGLWDKELHPLVNLPFMVALTYKLIE